MPEPQIKIALSLDQPTIRFGETTAMHLTVENRSNQPLILDCRDLDFRIGVRQLGRTPDGKDEPIGIVSSGRTAYAPLSGPVFSVGTAGLSLLINDGDIRLENGGMLLYDKTNEEWPITTLDGDLRVQTIPPNSCMQRTYTIGNLWSINQYELCAHANLIDPDFEVSSVPISFDVK